MKIRALWLIGLSVVLVGCSAGRPTQPVEARFDTATSLTEMNPVTGASGFYPLDIGNHWEYERILRLTIIPVGQPSMAVQLIRELQDHDLTGFAERDGILYTVEQWSTPTQPGTPVVFYRQDASGLYEADPPHPTPTALASRADEPLPGASSIRDRVMAAIGARFPDPSDRAAMGVAWLDIERKLIGLLDVAGSGWARLHVGRGRPGGVGQLEITRLAYPLTPETRWVIRYSPRFECTVEGVETFPAHSGRVRNYRIRVDSELFGSEDRVLLYESPIGYTGLRGVFTSEARDEQGNPVGTLLTEQIERLIDYRLVIPGER